MLILGGLFLLYKSVVEIHESLEGGQHDPAGPRKIAGDRRLLYIDRIDVLAVSWGSYTPMYTSKTGLLVQIRVSDPLLRYQVQTVHRVRDRRVPSDGHRLRCRPGVCLPGRCAPPGKKPSIGDRCYFGAARAAFQQYIGVYNTQYTGSTPTPRAMSIGSRRARPRVYTERPAPA